MKNVWKEEKTNFRVEKCRCSGRPPPAQERVFFLPLVLSLHRPPFFLLISLDMGSNIWVWPLDPIAPQDVAWMHFPNVAEALRYLRSEEGGSLRIQHTQAHPTHSTNHHPLSWLHPRARSAPPRHPRPICQPLGSRLSDVLAAVQTFAAPSRHAASATGLLMRHACNLWKDWYSVFHVLVVHVGTSWHPTQLNLMHVISVCTPPAPLMVFVRGVPRGSPCLLLFLRHVSSPMHGS